VRWLVELVAVSFLKKRGSPKYKSPLKDKPLRNPGQSLDEEIDRLINEEGISWVTTTIFCLVMLFLEWYRWQTKTEPNPVAMVIVIAPVIGFASFKLLSIARQVKRLKMARDGEKAVGQYLSDLRESGYRVFHDILGDEFNIDHIIISDRGIFTVETKTYSKPSKGRAEIHFDGETLLINSHRSYRDPVVQAQAQANWCRQTLQESTGKVYPVKPVIVFPGWFIKSTATNKRNALWVLNPKALPAFIKNEPPSLKPEDVQLAAYHLSRYIRMKR
jgi:hypothetical protein